MSLNFLLDYNKLFFNIFKKSILMKNKIINVFLKVIQEVKMENNIDSTSSHILKHYTNDSIVQLHKLFFLNIILIIQSKSNNHITLALPALLIKICHWPKRE